jgi:hypothetical protein
MRKNRLVRLGFGGATVLLGLNNKKTLINDHQCCYSFL